MRASPAFSPSSRPARSARSCVTGVIPGALRRESRPLRQRGQRCDSAITRHQGGTGEEPRRRLHLPMALHIVQKGDGA